MKSCGSTTLAEESKQPSVDCATWLLVASVMEIYNEKEQVEQGKMQNVQIVEERDTRRCKQITEKRATNWNKGSGGLRTRPMQLSFQLVKRNSRKSW